MSGRTFQTGAQRLILFTVVDVTFQRVAEREIRELRQANEILRKASAYFAMAELDRRPK